jgi:3-oxoadipate enol-lactonase
MIVTTTDGCRLNAMGTGREKGRALVLSNSLGTDVTLWDRQMAAFSAVRDVWRYDTRGHGGSDAPVGEYSIARLGQDLLAVMDHAGLARADLCGISIGGMTALWVAIHAPDRVRRLVLANTGAKIGNLDLWRERIRVASSEGVGGLADATMQRWFTAGFRQRDPGTVAHFHSTMAGTRAAGYVGCCAALRDADLRDAASQVRTPALVITGAQDPATTPADGEWLRQAIPGARLVQLESAHLSNVECAGAFTPAVLDFLTMQEA